MLVSLTYLVAIELNLTFWRIKELESNGECWNDIIVAMSTSMASKSFSELCTGFHSFHLPTFNCMISVHPFMAYFLPLQDFRQFTSHVQNQRISRDSLNEDFDKSENVHLLIFSHS